MSATEHAPARRRSCLVTGAAAGLGREIATALATAGYDVALADVDAAGMAETARDPAFRDAPPAIALDLRSRDSIEAGLADAVSALGGVDLLVNNAGITLHKPAVDVSWDEWDAVLGVNLKGAFFLSTAYARQRIGRGAPGSIVNIGSAHGLVGFADRAPYGISKAAVHHMTRMLAIEWAAAGIRVNAVAPGTVMTPSRQQLLEDPVKRERMLGRIPIGRFPDPAEVAGAVLFLDSPAAGAVTGQVIVVDGGTTVA